MRRRLSSLALFTAGLLLAPAAVQAQPCRGPDDTSALLIDDLVAIGTGTDAYSTTQRTTFALPAVSAAEVVLVSDQRTCARARDAFNVALPAGGDTLTAVYVVRVGPRCQAR